MKIIAVLCSDIHLSHTPPIARSAEPDWYEAMRRPIQEVRDICNTNQVPLIIAGDIFDRWNSVSELVNFAIREFGQIRHRIYTIPGQHDLPAHSYSEMNRSSYFTLHAAGVIADLGRTPLHVGPLRLHPFPWGHEVVALPGDFVHHPAVDLAVVHQYLWKVGHSYPGAPEGCRVGAMKDVLSTYTAAVFGDNHKGFLAGQVLNCGGFMRRKIDEVAAQPHVGLLFEDGSIDLHYLDTTADKFVEVSEVLNVKADVREGFEEYLAGLAELGIDSFDFREEVERHMDTMKVSAGVRKICLGHLEFTK